MNKLSKFFGFGVLALFLMSFASAAVTFSDVTLPISEGAHTVNITITPELPDSSITATSISDLSTIDLSVAATATPNVYAITYTIPAGFDFFYGKDYSVILNATGNTSGIASKTISFEVANPTTYADNGKLKISIDDLTVENGFGEDESWYPFDEIKAKINVENTNSGSDDKVKNIYVHWGLYNSDDGTWVVSGKESKFTLSDNGDDKTLDVTFQLDKLSKFKDHTSDKYTFYVWADGEDANGTGTSDYNLKDIDMQFDDDFVILNNLQVAETASCGSSLQVTADVVNIGTGDESNVYVVIYNKELGINQKVEIGDIDSMEDAKLDASITLPSDADEKTYSLSFSVYNEDDEVFQNSNDDDSKFSGTFTLSDCTTVAPASVTAALDSDAKAGNDFSVTATITNTGSKTNTFSVALDGYDSWASLVSLDKTSVTLEAGKSADIVIKLNANKGVSGSQAFNVILTSGNKVLTQPVEVSVAGASPFAGLTGLFSGVKGNNAYLWAVIGANVLLVLIIIVVAVRVSRKKE